MNIVKRNGFYYLVDEYMNNISLPCSSIFPFDNRDRWIIRDYNNLCFLINNKGNRISDYYEYISSLDNGYYTVIKNNVEFVLEDNLDYKVRSKK